jgi:diguanylate cyclase (GGDEF)-like protein
VDDTGNVIAVNAAWRAFTASTGGDSAACGEGSNYLKACEQVPPDSIDAPFAAAVAEGLQGVLAARLDRYQHEYPCHAPGEEGWFSVRISRAEIYGSRGAVISHVDVTEMHAVQTALSHQTLHDALTGLPNRVLLTDRLSQALADNERQGSYVAVAFLDIDHFKRVNDSLGHQVGDVLLVQVAQRLRRRIRAGDTLARFSGDEFVVVWRDLDSTQDVPGLGDRLTEALNEPFDLGSTSVNISVSIGIVVGHPMQSVDDLLMAADAAMYDAKRHGRGQVRMFTHELRTNLEERMATEVDLRAALMRSELVLHYQPVIDLGSGRPVAVEALVRWEHPERGLLGPHHFISVAESSNLIVPLGRWVLNQACRDAVAFSATAEGLDVAVNVSVRQLTQPQFPHDVRDALTRTGLDPRRLMLEVTESMLMEDAEAAAGALDAVSALGVSIAIDDFGTGYSSLHYLRRYPVSALKLDRAFVADICRTPDDAAICSSVIGLAHAVGATSIAEGVETTQQYETLRQFGCQKAQGFLWSPAVPFADLPDVLSACLNVPVPTAGGRSGAPPPHADGPGRGSTRAP